MTPFDILDEASQATGYSTPGWNQRYLTTLQYWGYTIIPFAQGDVHRSIAHSPTPLADDSEAYPYPGLIVPANPLELFRVLLLRRQSEELAKLLAKRGQGADNRWLHFIKVVAGHHGYQVSEGYGFALSERMLIVTRRA